MPSIDKEDMNDLTKGPIIKKLILFFLPIAAGTLFQQFYNAVDAFVVSIFVGTDALAAVGGSPAIVINLIIGFCTSLAGGCAVVIAQYYGAGNYKKVKAAVKTSYIFCVLLGLVVGVAVIIFSPSILTLLKTPADTLSDAITYQRIYFSAGIFLMVYNMGAGILRAVGNSRLPFICLFVGCGINIALDILFVAVFDLGVAGVAWATVIAQAVSAVLVTEKMLTMDERYRLSFGKNIDFSTSILGNMMKIGLPAGVQSSMYGISNMILQVGVNTLGKIFVASWAMTGKIDGAYWAVAGAFGTAITTFTGQNYGAGDRDRVKKTAKYGMAVFIGMTVALIGMILCMSKPLLNLLSDDIEVIDTTYYIMWFFVPFYILWSAIEVYSGVLRGIGDTVLPSLIIAVGICVSRIIWMYTAFETWQTAEVLCLSYPISWLITTIAISIYYKVKSKNIKMPEEILLK